MKKNKKKETNLSASAVICWTFPLSVSIPGFVAYLGFVTVLVAHRHPVMLVFCQLLIDRNKVQEPDKETELRK